MFFQIFPAQNLMFIPANQFPAMFGGLSDLKIKFLRGRRIQAA